MQKKNELSEESTVNYIGSSALASKNNAGEITRQKKLYMGYSYC